MLVNKGDELGQVFTSKKVAQLMVNLLEPRLNTNSRCIDPCLGKNVFFKCMKNICLKEMVGIEADESLITPETIAFYSNKNRKLLIKNFFDYESNELFDAVIMNPPYVRQEKLNGSINSKENIRNLFNDTQIPRKSNLYIYFFFKALKHLKKDGVLVAITYDSWLFTQFGDFFKRIITNAYNVEKIIHFRKGAFDNVDVGATIVLISSMPQQAKIEYYLYDSPDQLPDSLVISPQKCKMITVDDLLSFNRVHPSEIDFSSNFFVPLSSLSEKKISRGTNAIINQFFIFKKEQFPGHMKKFIKDVTQISKFVIKDEWQYLLAVTPSNISTDLINYLNYVKSEVINSPAKYKFLSSNININDRWYIIKIKNPGNIIFNYYMRNNIHFIYNPDFIKNSDNFYNLTITKDALGNLAILNSNLTKYTLLKFSRMQGNGLFKMQLFEFENVPVANINNFDNGVKLSLEQLGKKLLDADRKNSKSVVEEIDDILIKEYNTYCGKNITVKKLHHLIEQVRGGIIDSEALV